MPSQDLKLFNLLNQLTKKRFEKYSKYFVNDSKQFINKIDRDYKKSGKFPAHILKQIKKIPKEKYDSAICVLRGALPYSLLFEAEGWKIHYVICGRKNENFFKKKRFNLSIDSSIKEISNKKVLIIENNSPTGTTPTIVRDKLIESFNIKKPDLFIDYFILGKENPPEWIKGKAFWEDNKKLSKFGRVYESINQKVSKKERDYLIKEFIENIKKINLSR